MIDYLRPSMRYFVRDFEELAVSKVVLSNDLEYFEKCWSAVVTLCTSKSQNGLCDSN